MCALCINVLVFYIHVINVIFFSFKEMIIDKVNGQVVPRYLIYDIIKFNVSTFSFIAFIISY